MDPEHFSLFKLTTRTTSALEAYNGVLGRLIQKRGNFFKFVEVLRDEEYEKSKNFSTLIESGGTEPLVQSSQKQFTQIDQIRFWRYLKCWSKEN